jgi:hypothetical protein
VTVAATVTTAAVWVLRRVVRASTTGAARRVGPLLVGAALAVGALAVAGSAVDVLVAEVAGRLPSVFAAGFRDVALSVEAFYGSGTVVLALMTGCLLVAGALVLASRLLLYLGYVSRRRAGFALASGGLFLATAFAGTLDTPPLLVLGGLVVSLLVWDAGEYATTLGAEVGREARTRSGELVHAGGTLAVGVAGVAAALAGRALLSGWEVGASPATGAGLVAVLVGVVLLVAALR